MKKLTFTQVKKNYALLSEEQMKEILGGDGVISGGTGTSTDPYVIYSHMTIGSGTMSANNYNAVVAGINEYNNTSGVVSGKYFKFNITYSNDGSAVGPSQTVSTADGNVTYNQVHIAQSSGSGGGTSSDPVVGTTNSGTNKVTYYAGTMSGISGNQQNIVQRATVHELAHTFGVRHDSDAAAMNNFETNPNTQVLTSQPGGVDNNLFADALGGDKIHWGSNVTKPSGF
jgi:natural product precursor